MPLTEKEIKELETLENPEVKFFSPSTSIIPSFFLSSNNLQRRKERAVHLRTKLIMEKQDLDENKDWQKYYQIKKEVEDKFDERFKK